MPLSMQQKDISSRHRPRMNCGLPRKPTEVGSNR